MTHDPKARVAIQCEMDPVDREIARNEVRVLDCIEKSLQRIAQALERIADAQAPVAATTLTATVTDIPRTEP